MSKKDFDDYINAKGGKPKKEAEFDWEKQKDEWIVYLDKFYNIIEGFLKEYIDNESMAIKYQSKSMFEENIGSYEINILNICIGSKKLKFDPIGTMLFGAKGRVDLIGSNGSVRFVLVNKNLSAPKIKVAILSDGEKKSKDNDPPKDIEWEWKISTNPPRIQYLPLEQDLFLSSMLEVLGG